MSFTDLLRSFPRPGDPLGFSKTWREAAVRRGMVPIIHDWEVGYAVDAAGEVYSSADDDWSAPSLVPDARVRHAIRARAAALHPELANLQPVRRPGDPECLFCHGGSTRPGFPDVLCDCGNLGWVPGGGEAG